MTPTAAQDSVVRMALGMWAADPRAAITPAQRQWVIERLQNTVRLTSHERTLLRESLCAYVKEHHPRIAHIVAHQFGDEAC